MRWLGFLNSELHPAFKLIYLPVRLQTDEAVAVAIIEASRIRVREFLARLDARLEGRDWLTGERSIADPYLYVMLRWAIRLEIGLDGFANLVRFAERMYHDPGVRAAITAEEDGLSQSRSQFFPAAENTPVPDYRKVS
jgi:glutathione S-transferase